MRYVLLIEYDGTAFVGWQMQKDGLSVQEALQNALFGLCGNPVEVSGAGRTDAGVHALAQAAHFDIETPYTPEKLRLALNALLRPHPVAVLSVTPAPDGFHARFSARERSYVYRILCRPGAPPALEKNRVWWVSRPLDMAVMQKGADALLGRHDFSSFRAAACQADSPVRTLDVFAWEKAGDELRATVRARSFLHHQVRNMVGTLKMLGEGKLALPDIPRILEARDRRAAGPTAPAEGLYLKEVLY